MAALPPVPEATQGQQGFPNPPPMQYRLITRDELPYYAHIVGSKITFSRTINNMEEAFTLLEFFQNHLFSSTQYQQYHHQAGYLIAHALNNGLFNKDFNEVLEQIPLYVVNTKDDNIFSVDGMEFRSGNVTLSTHLDIFCPDEWNTEGAQYREKCFFKLRFDSDAKWYSLGTEWYFFSEERGRRNPFCRFYDRSLFKSTLQDGRQAIVCVNGPLSLAVQKIYVHTESGLEIVHLRELGDPVPSEEPSPSEDNFMSFFKNSCASVFQIRSSELSNAREAFRKQPGMHLTVLASDLLQSTRLNHNIHTILLVHPKREEHQDIVANLKHYGFRVIVVSDSHIGSWLPLPHEQYLPKAIEGGEKGFVSDCKVSDGKDLESGWEYVGEDGSM